MRSKLPYLAYLIIGIFVFFGCSDDETEIYGPNTPSYRDGVYSGKQLTFTLDGAEVPTVTSVFLRSTLKDANLSPDKGPDDVCYPSNPTYYTTVKIEGFPKKGETTTFKTVSDIMGFKGEMTVGGVTYDYIGEFTGDPLMHHDTQGLILNMTTK